MSIREFSEKDYTLLESWWKAHGWSAPSIEALPQTGFIVNDCVAGFLYQTDSVIGWVEWVISDPRTEVSKRDQSLDELMSLLVDAGDLLGFKFLFTSLEHKGLIERYQKHGFQVTDKSVTNMMRRI